MSGTGNTGDNLVKSIFAATPQGFTCYVDFASGFCSPSQNVHEVYESINSTDSFWDKFAEMMETGDVYTDTPAEESPLLIAAREAQALTEEFDTHSFELGEIKQKLDEVEKKDDRALNAQNFFTRCGYNYDVFTRENRFKKLPEAKPKIVIQDYGVRKKAPTVRRDKKN